MKHLVLLLAGCAFLAACSTPKTHSRVGSTCCFPKVKTYAFVPDKAMRAAEGLSNDAVWHEEITKAISEELATKKLTQATVANRDVFVAFHFVWKSDETTMLVNNYAGYKLSKKETEQADLSKIIDAAGKADSVTLVIDVIDPVKREIIWRGWTQSKPHPHRTVQERKEGIRRVVHRVLADFPPKH